MKKLNETSYYNFVKTIFVGQSRGQSVIQICDKLVGGDKFKSLKLIAKFKTILANKKNEVEQIILDLKAEGIVIENPYMVDNELMQINFANNNSKEENIKNNIIAFKPQSTINENELNSLFLGLCKLVKKLAIEEAELTFQKRERDLQSKLKRQIENLQMLNEGLAMENKRLTEKICGSTLQSK